MAQTSIDIQRISKNDDLAAIAASITSSEWGDDNEMVDYDEHALREYVNCPDNLLLIAYAEGKPVGIVLAMKVLKPYKGHQNWLYIDEIDVKPRYRRRGIGKALTKHALGIAKEWGLSEVWLGTEPDNLAANRLYSSLNPSEIKQFSGYTYKVGTSKHNG